MPEDFDRLNYDDIVRQPETLAERWTEIQRLSAMLFDGSLLMGEHDDRDKRGGDVKNQRVEWELDYSQQRVECTREWNFGDVNKGMVRPAYRFEVFPIFNYKLGEPIETLWFARNIETLQIINEENKFEHVMDYTKRVGGNPTDYMTKIFDYLRASENGHRRDMLTVDESAKFARIILGLAADLKNKPGMTQRIKEFWTGSPIIDYTPAHPKNWRLRKEVMKRAVKSDAFSSVGSEPTYKIDE